MEISVTIYILKNLTTHTRTLTHTHTDTHTHAHTENNFQSKKLNILICTDDDDACDITGGSQDSPHLRVQDL